MIEVTGRSVPKVCEHLGSLIETKGEYPELIHLVHSGEAQVILTFWMDHNVKNVKILQIDLNVKSLLFTILRTKDMVNMRK